MSSMCYDHNKKTNFSKIIWNVSYSKISKITRELNRFSRIINEFICILFITDDYIDLIRFYFITIANKKFENLCWGIPSGIPYVEGTRSRDKGQIVIFCRRRLFSNNNQSYILTLCLVHCRDLRLITKEFLGSNNLKMFKNMHV